MGADRARRELEAFADLPVGQAARRQAHDLLLLRGEVRQPVPSTGVLADPSGPQLSAGAGGPGLGAQPYERLQRGGQQRPGPARAQSAAQPLRRPRPVRPHARRHPAAELRRGRPLLPRRAAGQAGGNRCFRSVTDEYSGPRARSGHRPDSPRPDRPAWPRDLSGRSRRPPYRRNVKSLTGRNSTPAGRCAFSAGPVVKRSGRMSNTLEGNASCHSPRDPLSGPRMS